MCSRVLAPVQQAECQTHASNCPQTSGAPVYQVRVSRPDGDAQAASAGPAAPAGLQPQAGQHHSLWNWLFYSEERMTQSLGRGQKVWFFTTLLYQIVHCVPLFCRRPPASPRW